MKKYKILNRNPKISHACVPSGFQKRLPTQPSSELFFLMEELCKGLSILPLPFDHLVAVRRQQGGGLDL
jgi:hypothetical protein